MTECVAGYPAGRSNQLWIRNRLFDLCLVTGGAFLTLLVALAAFQMPRLLPWLFWIWVVAFEGSHFWATFSRTYFDASFRRRHPRLLWGSLVFFVFPALALAFDARFGGGAAATAYGFFIFCWSLFHNARQHYGFTAIYTRKAGVGDNLRSHLVGALYAAVCLAQVHFLVNFKLPGTYAGFAALLDGGLRPLLFYAPPVLSLVAAVYLAYLAHRLWQVHGAAAFMPLFYTAVCWLFYSVMFYAVAPLDTFVQNLNGAETLMLIAIMNSLFHNIQYHAIVYHYGQRRYRDSEEPVGAARWINRDALHYGVVALAVGALFGLIVWHLGDWPDVFGRWHQGGMHAWAYILFFGIIGHHFYLDQQIWRPSRSRELRETLS